MIIPNNFLANCKYLFLIICFSVFNVNADPNPQIKCSTSIKEDAEYLLNTTDFINSQYNMSIDGFGEKDGKLYVVTTGARFEFQPANNKLLIWQRLGKKRLASTVNFPVRSLLELKIIKHGTGAVFLANNNVKIRINADSLMMMKAVYAMILTYKINFKPEWTRQFYSNYLFLDEFGGFGSYPATKGKAAPLLDSQSVRYSLHKGQILWLAIAPPKPYDWVNNKNKRVIWHWSKKNAYPKNNQIAKWSKKGNILLQQSELMLWKDWNLSFVPRNGIAEIIRVNTACKKNGLRNILYTSPYYFLKATPAEKRSINTFKGFVRFPKGEGTGRNWPLFINEIKKVMKDCKPDGLYFDGIYNNVVRTYIVTRKAREIVGDDKILEFHATGSAPGKFVYLPQIDTYYDIILRGEGHQGAYKNPQYLRYFVSTLNISNSIGVLCNNNKYKLTEQFINALLDYNIQLHWVPGAKYKTGMMDKFYWPVLKNEDLKQRNQKAINKRIQKNTKIRANQTNRKSETPDSQPDKNEYFQKPITLSAREKDKDSRTIENSWMLYFSKNSEGVFSASSGLITISANANTCVLIEKTIAGNVNYVHCNIKAVKNCGQSWGPALLLKLGKYNLRMGLRSDGCIQIDGPDGQLFYYGYNSGIWHKLRLRLTKEYCFYEVFKDKKWHVLYTQSLAMVDNKKNIKFTLGKIPYSGGFEEYKDKGKIGICQFNEIKISSN